jgi:hypothetical protein
MKAMLLNNGIYLGIPLSTGQFYLEPFWLSVIIPSSKIFTK